MTEQEKQNCLNCRYAFEKPANSGASIPQSERRKRWVSFVQNSDLSQNEKQICLDEFIQYPLPEKYKSKPRKKNDKK